MSGEQGAVCGCDERLKREMHGDRHKVRLCGGDGRFEVLGCRW